MVSSLPGSILRAEQAQPAAAAASARALSALPIAPVSFWVELGKNVRASSLPTFFKTIMTVILKRLFDWNVETPYEADMSALKVTIRHDLIRCKLQKDLQQLPGDMQIRCHLLPLVMRYSNPFHESETITTGIAKYFLPTILREAAERDDQRDSIANMILNQIKRSSTTIPPDSQLTMEEVFETCVETGRELEHMSIERILESLEDWISSTEDFKSVFMRRDGNYCFEDEQRWKLQLLDMVLTRFPALHSLDIGFVGSLRHFSKFVDVLANRAQTINSVSLALAEDVSADSFVTYLRTHQHHQLLSRLQFIRLYECSDEFALEVQNRLLLAGHTIQVIAQSQAAAKLGMAEDAARRDIICSAFAQ